MLIGECKTCKILQDALEFERARNKELIEAITSLVKPAPVIQQEKTNVSFQPIPRGLTFTKRRAELEKQDRLRMEAEKSPHRAIPDKEILKETPVAISIDNLEAELGIKTVESE